MTLRELIRYVADCLAGVASVPQRISPTLPPAMVIGPALDDAGNILLRRSVSTPTGDYSATIAAVAHLVRDVGKAPVGIATPGAISVRTGLLKNSNSSG